MTPPTVYLVRGQHGPWRNWHVLPKRPPEGVFSEVVEYGPVEGLSDRFWLELREPGMVPERKGPFKTGGMAKTLREFMAARPAALISVVTIGHDGPGFEDGPQALLMLDLRSRPTARRHIETSKAAFAAGPVSEVERLRSALKACDRFFREAMPQINIKQSAMDANAIDAWNQAEIAVARARAALLGGE